MPAEPESSLKAIRIKLCGRSVLDLEIRHEAVAAWLTQKPGRIPVDVLVYIVELLGDAERRSEAAQTLWLAARAGHDLGVIEIELRDLLEQGRADERFYAALALACSAPEAERRTLLAIATSSIPNGAPPIGEVLYQGLHEIIARVGGRGGTPDLAQSTRCAACRGLRTGLVHEDGWSDNSGRQQTREYRCLDCGLFTIDYLND